MGLATLSLSSNLLRPVNAKSDLEVLDYEMKSVEKEGPPSHDLLSELEPDLDPR
jgi:hypothetical protein